VVPGKCAGGADSECRSVRAIVAGQHPSIPWLSPAVNPASLRAGRAGRCAAARGPDGALAGNHARRGHARARGRPGCAHRRPAPRRQRRRRRRPCARGDAARARPGALQPLRHWGTLAGPIACVRGCRLSACPPRRRRHAFRWAPAVARAAGAGGVPGGAAGAGMPGGGGRQRPRRRRRRRRRRRPRAGRRAHARRARAGRRRRGGAGGRRRAAGAPALASRASQAPRALRLRGVALAGALGHDAERVEPRAR